MDLSPTAPDPELLLSHAGFVRSLARALLARERTGGGATDSVDDIVQQTWLAALTKPPRDERALRSWLARVVRSRVHETRRADERRARREREAASAELVVDGDPARAAERLAVLRDVVDAVLALEEPARAVVIARYFEERTPTEIAARERVPVATIETRLRRAREQLRRKLDARHGDDRKAFLAALAGLANGGRSAAPIATPVAAAKWAALAATVAFVAWMGWVAWKSERSASGGVATSNAIASASAGAAGSNGGVEPVRAIEVAAGVDATSGNSVRLRVVAKEGGKPLAGATVHFVNAPEDPNARVRTIWVDEARARDRLYSEHLSIDGDWYLERQRELEATATRTGTCFTCDRDGEVTLPPFHVALVAVRQREFATAQWIERGDRQPQLFEVAQEVGLRIAVVDRSGRPLADVPVVLQSIQSNKKNQKAVGFWRGTTHGVSGIAEIAGAEILELRGRFKNGPMNLTVALGVAGFDAENIPIDLADPPSEPVRLTLPPTGRMHVRLTTADGAPLIEPARIAIKPDRISVNFDTLGADYFVQPASNGGVDVDHVDLNREFSIYLAVDDDELRPTITKVVGPTREDETTEVILAAGPPTPVVTGVLLRPDGEPLRNWPVRARYDITHNGHERLIETDEDGSFRLPLAVYVFEFDDRPGKGRVTGGTDATNQMTLTPEHAGELDPALANVSIVHRFSKEELEPGVHELGDLELGAATVIVAGRVVDTDHRPRADVEVEVEQFIGAHFMGSISGHIHHGRTKSDGTFSILGPPIPRRVRVVARGDDCFLATPLEFTFGARDLEIVVEKAGELRGTLMVDAGVRLDEITIDLSDDSTPFSTWSQDPSENVTIAADGTFRVARLNAGRGSVTIALGHRNYGRRDYEPIVTIDDVDVIAGAICADPRVKTIDLRGKLRPLDFTVRDDEGRPLSLAEVRLFPEPNDATHEFPRTARTGVDGVAHLTGLAPTYRVAVEKEGFESATVTDVPSSREVTLHVKH